MESVACVTLEYRVGVGRAACGEALQALRSEWLALRKHLGDPPYVMAFEYVPSGGMVYAHVVYRRPEARA